MKKEISTETLIELYRELEDRGIKVWLDGGWAVDALLGKQTRSHDDVDFVVQEKDLDALVSFLRNKGYKDIPRDDTRPWNFVLGDGGSSEVDIHVININKNGDGIYGPPENNEKYPAHALEGKGSINGHEVLCMSLKYQIENHTGYTLQDKDFMDVKNLCEKFNLQLPKEYQEKT